MSSARTAMFLATACLATACLAGCAGGRQLRPFPDRPVAWYEHDDEHVERPPATGRDWTRARVAHTIRDDIKLEIDRILAIELPRPAEDVNALDEVPCSTWFCPRNHLRRLSAEALRRGPPGFEPPVLPLRIRSGKPSGAAPGWVVEDARGRRFLAKYDPPGHLGLVTGAETLGPLLFHAIGYNVPRAYLLDVRPDEIGLAPGASYDDLGVQRAYTPEDVAASLAPAPRTADGRVRLVLIGWIPGKIVGPFDFRGRRSDDPNDRIPHEHRRSLRALRVFQSWVNYADASAANTIDSWISDGDRRYVRHYLIDFGGMLGAWTLAPKPPHVGAQHILAPNQWVRGLLTLGFIERDYQDRRPEWEAAVVRYPAVGWMPADDWDPRAWRSRRIVPAHQRMTDRDAYWAAKVVTSFTDDQIHTLVQEAGYPPDQAAYLERALRVRRDRIGRAYLTPVTAVEAPAMTEDRRLCFTDLAIARGAAAAGDVRYAVRVLDLDAARETPASIDRRGGARSCLAIPAGGRYHVVTITAIVDGRAAKAARVHLHLRPHERRLVVVGLERDE